MYRDGNSTLAGFTLRIAIMLAIWVGYTAYVFLFASASVVVLPVMAAALLPIFPLILWAAPELPGFPRRLTRMLIYAGCFLMPLWPVYLHIKLGPSPIITPTRLIFYMVAFVWIYEMSCVRLRRKQFLAALKRFGPLSVVVLLLFMQKFISVPFAEGKAIAGKEFFRQSMIWLLPFLSVITYISKRSELKTIITLMLYGSMIVAGIAIAEFGTRRLLAEILAPIIGHADWLTNVLEEKVRSGQFRAQATHTHPLSLGEHMAMMIPFGLYMVYCTRGKSRLFWAGGLGMLVLAVLVTNSRGALIAGLLALSAGFFLMLFAALKKPGAAKWRPLAGMIMAGAVLCAPVALAGAWKLSAGEAGSIEAESSQARIDQFTHAIPKILARPLNGYGNGRSVKVLGYYTVLLTIDNYYLNLLLDLGIPGAVLFLMQMILLGVYGSRWGLKLYDDPYGGIYLAFAAMAIAFAMMRSVLSITINIELLMILMAVFIGTAGATRRKVRSQTVRPIWQLPTRPAISPADLDRHRREIMAR